MNLRSRAVHDSSRGSDRLTVERAKSGGENEDEKVEKKEDSHLRERRFGSFARSVRVLDTVDVDKIEASFKNRVLKVTLPKKPEAQRPAKKIEVKGG